MGRFFDDEAEQREEETGGRETTASSSGVSRHLETRPPYYRVLIYRDSILGRQS
jgi:hypothetical protein